MQDDSPTIPVRMNKRTIGKTLRNMTGDFLLGLRDVQKSENGNSVRAHNQAAEDNTRLRVNIWYKEQRWQLERIKRGQRQFYKRLVKVHRDKRKCQREEYKRKQEELRRDVQNVRLRRLLKRVVEKFRQNVRRKKAERTRKRFAIAGGLRLSNEDGSVIKHGVFGLKNNPAESVTRMVKLAAKREVLQKEGVLPSKLIGVTDKNEKKKESFTAANYLTRDVGGNNVIPHRENLDKSVNSYQESKAPFERQATDKPSKTQSRQSTPPHSERCGNRLDQNDRLMNSGARNIHKSTDQCPKNTTDLEKIRSRVTLEKAAFTGSDRNGTQTVPVGPLLELNELKGEKSDRRRALAAREKRCMRQTNLEISKIGSKLTVENVAVHDQLCESSDGKNPTVGGNHHELSVFPGKTKVLRVNKENLRQPKSETLIAAVQNSRQHPELSGQNCDDVFAALNLKDQEYRLPLEKEHSNESRVQKSELGSLRVPRRATLKPPPTSFLLKIDEVDVVQNANTASSANSSRASSPCWNEEGHANTNQGLLLSQIIRRDRRAKEEQRLKLLNDELVPYYKRTPGGDLRVQMVPFVRASFKPPSNKIRYEQDKMIKGEKIKMARQRVRVRNFVHHCPVADPGPNGAAFSSTERMFHNHSFQKERKDEAPSSLAALMFSVYHQEMPPEGVDPNSVEALKKCRYIRYYDIAKKRDQSLMPTKQVSSWGSASLPENERRRLLAFNRERAHVYNR